jgi:hypothetical protein
MSCMTIELTVLLSVVAVCLTAFFGFKAYNRDKTSDDQEEAGRSATIMTKLENIDKGVSDIKEELKSVKADIRDDHDRIIRLEETVKQTSKNQFNHER